MMGVLVYVLFRPNTLALSWLSMNAPLAGCSFWGDDLIRYYVPDTLWCASLCMSLFRLHLPNKKTASLIAFSALLLGCVWEWLQTGGSVAGTGDFMDCLAYGVGSAVALCIYFPIKRRIQ